MTVPLKKALRSVVLPILALERDRRHTCIGTGFVVAARGREALLVTAAHVIKRIREIDSPYPRHHPSTPDFFSPSDISMSLRKLNREQSIMTLNMVGMAPLSRRSSRCQRLIWLCAKCRSQTTYRTSYNSRPD
jgi:hypothetical protein